VVAYINQLVAPATYIVKDAYTTKHNGARHFYARQTANDLEIINADLNINVWQKKVLSVGNSFFKGPTPPTTVPQLQSSMALQSLGKFLGHFFESTDLIITDFVNGGEFKHIIKGYPGAIKDVKSRLAYVQVDYGTKLELVWEFELDVHDHWWNTFVSTTTGDIIALFDWVDDATYQGYPIGTNDPDDGPREVIVNPEVSNASPLGWHNQGDDAEFTLTIGNNAYAQENWSGGSAWLNNYRPNGGSILSFRYPFNENQEPDTNIDASVTNLFYWNNLIHDIFYQYGFDEVSGNFQENNFNRGGLGNDAVQANAQDGSGYNNANFATPPDGQRPRMRMYVWTYTNPYRDGDFDQGIIIHEYAHGISNRLTGGPGNVNCLNTAEAGGMGEGWGDFFGTAIRQRPEYNRNDIFGLATYDIDDDWGIRNYPYTSQMNINPETYNYITRAGYGGVHAKGAVWCGILWEVYWNLVESLQFSDNWYLGEGGNNVILRDVIDGMKIQPCNPTFVSARDAILQADMVNHGGENFCDLWQGFAKRGLGVGAVAGGTESFQTPPQCAQ